MENIMKVLREKKTLDCSASTLWSILSDVTRCDWVPTINKIELEGDCRIFEMEGMGQIKEQILLLDNETMTLQYSAIETRTPIDHHLATIQIKEDSDNSCILNWSTEIEPDIFAEAIHQGMLLSIEGIKKVIS
jgi:hypothetical protein|tara:strand:- start:297 stop:695 length:399 start_codon:yes stop_codon:yes gene_type:complete